MRFRAIVLAGALTAGLVAGGLGVAEAVTPPAPGTPECTTQVENTTEVQTARANLAAAQATVRNDRTAYDAAVSKLNTQNSAVSALSAALGTTVTNLFGITGVVTVAEVDQAKAAVAPDQQAVNDALAKLQADQTKVTTAQNDLRGARNHQSGLICTGTPGNGTVGVTGPGDADAFALVNGDINALVCDNESGQLAKIRTDALAVQDKLTPAQIGQLRTALAAKLAALDCSVKPDPATVVCPGKAAPATSTPVAPAQGSATETTTPTSTPLTLGAVPAASAPVSASGSQVGTVPSGAVNTGDGSTVR